MPHQARQHQRVLAALAAEARQLFEQTTFPSKGSVFAVGSGVSHAAGAALSRSALSRGRRGSSITWTSVQPAPLDRDCEALPDWDNRTQLTPGVQRLGIPRAAGWAIRDAAALGPLCDVANR